jgi:chorismate mutase
VIIAASHLNRLRWPFVLALVMLLLGGCAAKPVIGDTERSKLDELLKTMRAQLDVAAQAARDAFLAQREPSNTREEAEFVESAVNRSLDYTLAPEVVQEFFSAQMEAAKLLQTALQEQWQKDPKTRPQKSASNAESIRPRVGLSSAALLAAFAQAQAVLREEGSRDLLLERANTILAGVPGGPKVATKAIAPLYRLAK